MPETKKASTIRPLSGRRRQVDALSRAELLLGEVKRRGETIDALTDALVALRWICEESQGCALCRGSMPTLDRLLDAAMVRSERTRLDFVLGEIEADLRAERAESARHSELSEARDDRALAS